MHWRGPSADRQFPCLSSDCLFVGGVCLLARWFPLFFFILRSGQTIARASIETLPHKRVAAAYIHWLIAANGIASSQRDALGYGCCSCCWLWQGHRRTLPPSLAATRSPPLASQDGHGMADPFINFGDGLSMSCGIIPHLPPVPKISDRRGQAHENRTGSPRNLLLQLLPSVSSHYAISLGSTLLQNHD